MPRLQQAPAPLTAEDVPEPSLPPVLEIRSLPLLERLDALREPGVSQREVDLFLEGLSAILPEHESPRVRADLMLDVLEDSRLCELTGSNGARVGATALEVLLELGYPYALEVTPAMLARARVAARTPLPRSVFVGLGAAALTSLLCLSGFLSQFLSYLDLLEHPIGESWVPQGFDSSVTWLPLFLALLMAPPLFTGLSWMLRLRVPTLLFNVTQWLVGGWTVWLGVNRSLFDLSLDAGSHQVSLVLFGLLTLGGAFCLRPRAQAEPTPLPGPRG